MLMRQAVDIINTQMGFMVSFEHKEGCMLLSDYFPEKYFGEELIPTEEEAWVLAKKFAAKTVGRCVNVYVVAHDFSPVPGYEARRIDNRNGAKMIAVDNKTALRNFLDGIYKGDIDKMISHMKQRLVKKPLPTGRFKQTLVNDLKILEGWKDKVLL